jgi:carbamoyltransferase
MAGGVALNCVATGKLLRSNTFKDLWIQPASGDAGGAVGAAYAAWHIWKNKERQVDPTQDSMNGAYLGPEYHSAEIVRMAKRNNAVFEEYPDSEQLYQYVADLLSHGKIIGWFQGRMEYGPRALGNRSILGDPRHPQMQKRLNLKIKYREGFRPFAPSVLEEDIDEYFELNRSSPYMTLVAPVQKKRRNPLPENYAKMGMYERLYHLRSDIPAVTHVDYSARIQSVSRRTNQKYWELINAFKDKTGYGLLVNTSFNVRGEPIVCTPDDAYKCFMRTEMDYLVANNFIFDKLKQPEWIQSDDWKDEFSKD